MYQRYIREYNRYEFMLTILKGVPMKIDRYTKVVLTIIAIALVMDLAGSFVEVAEASWSAKDYRMLETGIYDIVRAIQGLDLSC